MPIITHFVVVSCSSPIGPRACSFCVEMPTSAPKPRSTSVKKAAAAESTRSTGRRVAAATQNPPWLAPTAVVLLVLGLAYLVTYYISSGQLPLPIGDWNLAAGFGVLMVGGGMLMFWK